MEHSQLSRCYQVFKDEVLPPYEEIKQLSNGDKIGKCYKHVMTDESTYSKNEILKYIKDNHIENIEDV
jgi:hypothetical protein